MRIMVNAMKQFGIPKRFPGRIAGFIMATRSSNIERSEWGISLLNIQQSEYTRNRFWSWCGN